MGADRVETGRWGGMKESLNDEFWREEIEKI